MISPRRARVRPRVMLPGGSEAVALDALIGDLPTEAGEVLGIIGDSGWGKTTALEHLAAVAGGRTGQAGQQGLLDDPEPEDVRHAAAFGPVVYASSQPAAVQSGRHRLWRLAAWTSDDLVEYALATDAAGARSVLRRALALYERDSLDGLPTAWGLVLDAMFADEAVVDVAAVIGAALGPVDGEACERMRRLCVESVLGHGDPEVNRPLPLAAVRLMQCRSVRMALAVEFLETVLVGGEGYAWLKQRWPRELVAQCGAGLSERARGFLREVLKRGYREAQPMAASVLHAAGQRVPLRTVPNLDGSYLNGFAASRAALKKLRARRADMAGGDFRRADLGRALFIGADLSRACLAETRLRNAVFDLATLAGADLREANACEASFKRTRLEGANLEDTQACRAVFEGAVLRGARLVRADFANAEFDGAELDEADASGAVFDQAHLCHLDLRTTVLAGASFRRATFDGCDLSGQVLQAPDFWNAILENTDLTGSVLTNANFAGALFPGAGLAEVHWEHANLRGSDLRGCTFHMGSSRSGLVFSPIACEGSRTGFYSEDLEDFTHKTPEEVRKANLRGADLRGCLLEGVDFYLVDLRDARYDEDAEKWFRKCGAILEDPRL